MDRTSRRHQVGIVAGAVTSVAALAVLVALLPEPPSPDISVRTPPRPTASVHSPAAAPRSGLTDLPRGRAAHVGVLVGDTLTEPDGSVTVVPAAARRSGITAATRAGDALLVADGRIFEGSVGLSLVEGGHATPLGPCATQVVASAPDGRAAWVSFGCPESGVPAPTTLVRRAPDGTTTSSELTFPADTDVLSSAVGFVGDRVVVDRAFVGGAVLVDEHGGLATVPGVDGIDAVGPDGRAAIAVLDGGASAVVDPVSGGVRWRRPELVAFSPDGSRVLAGHGPLTAHDTRSGRRVATLAPPGGVRIEPGPVWEDDAHVLVVARDAGGRAVVRLGLDGTVERAGEALPGRGQVLLVP